MENISLLNLGGKFPREVITLVVFKSDRPKFKKEPVELYNNKSICVTGKVTLYKDKLQIVMNEPKQVKVINFVRDGAAYDKKKSTLTD